MASSSGPSSLNLGPTTVRQHGGALAPQGIDGSLLPQQKRRRINTETQPRPGPVSKTDAAPHQAPLLLSEAQSEDLGEYILRDSSRLRDIGFENLVREWRKRSNFHPEISQLRHKAARLLNHLHKRGANVTLATPPWDEERLNSTIQRGPHKSATEYVDFLKEELLDFVQKGFWMVLPLKLLKKYPSLYKNLRVSPMGVVPQRARRPRIIVDYSYFGLNQETLKMAPRDAMQFGKALQRILQALVDANPIFGPVHLLKVDIADGFYRIWLNVADIPKLACSLPQMYGEEPLLALPLVLPMGWTESPPYFCTATETVADITNKRLMNRWEAPHHRLEEMASTNPQPDADLTGSELTGDEEADACPAAVQQPTRRPYNRRTRRRPLRKVDVFVDDFIAMGQGSRKALSRVRRTLLHSLDEVLRPLDEDDDRFRKEPASVKKLQQGDAAWGTRKLILGWIIDTLAMTLELPHHRKLRLHTILDEIPRSQKRISVKKWQQVLGELRSMSIALPGSRGLFSLMQEALRHQADSRLRLTKEVHAALDDFRWLAKDLTTRPTRLYEIVPQPDPELLGAQDASGIGMGGVWFPASTAVQTRNPDSSAAKSSAVPTPILWRARFPQELVRDLISDQNKTGQVTNSDFELAAGLVQHDVAAHAFDIREKTIATGSDNTPTIAWQTKGSTTTTSAPAYLLRLQALHQRYHRYQTSSFFVPGRLNAMADDCSRLWHLTDTELLSHFNSKYPQTASWRLAHPRPGMLSSVTSALRRRRPEPELYLREPNPTTGLGSSGPNSVKTWPSIPGSLTTSTPSFSFKCLPNAIEQAHLPPAVDLSSLAQWKAPSVPWVRPLRAWGPQTLD